MKILTTILLLLVARPVHSEELASSHLRTVEEFIAAFNLHDSRAMAAHVAEDVAWLSVDSDKISMESRGKSALIASMDAYFESCPTCQSALLGTISTPGRISAVEIASWQGTTGPKSQKAISVYEFSEGLIQRVYYFPAEK